MSFLNFIRKSSGLTKLHVLVGSEESHELWHLDDLNLSSSVDIEVSEGLVEVGIEVLLEGGSSESLMGGEDLGGGGLGGVVVHPENTVWLSTEGLTLDGVLLDHGSHEDIIGVGGESSGGDSSVTSINHTIHSNGESLSGVVNWLSSEHNVLLAGGGGFLGHSGGETKEGGNYKCLFHFILFQTNYKLKIDKAI